LAPELREPVKHCGRIAAILGCPCFPTILIRDLEPFRQAWPVWDRAAEMILVARTTGVADGIAEATRQLLVAVERENWWRRQAPARCAAHA